MEKFKFPVTLQPGSIMSGLEDNPLSLCSRLIRNKQYDQALSALLTAKTRYPELLGLLEKSEGIIRKKTNKYKPEPPNVRSKSAASVLNAHFDMIYLVNLQTEINSRLLAEADLHSRGIKFKLWPAIDGRKKEIETQFLNYKAKPLGSLVRNSDLNDREIRRKKHYIESPGAMGYIWTYVNILKNAKANNYQKILIIEDDLAYAQDFDRKLVSLLTKIPRDWLVLKLGASQYDWTGIDLVESEKKGYYRPERIKTAGSFAIGVSHEVFDKIIIEAEFFETPFDVCPLGAVYRDYPDRCYVAYPNLVMPDVRTSTIRGPRDQHAHAEKMKWRITDFEFPRQKVPINIVFEDSSHLGETLILTSKYKESCRFRYYFQSTDGLRPLHLTDRNISHCEGLIAKESLTGDEIQLQGAWTISRRSPPATEALIHHAVKGVGRKPGQPSVQSRVSVVIPTYKRNEGLYAAMDSVLSQDYSDIELIVVSDNEAQSPFNDSIKNIVKDMSQKYPERLIKVIFHRANRNGAAARNTGIFAATGEYVCFLDDDDLYLPGRISEAVKRFDELPLDCNIVVSGYLGWNSPDINESRYSLGDIVYDLAALNYKNHYVHTGTVTYRRDAVIEENGFDELFRRNQDLEFNMRMFSSNRAETVRHAGLRLKPDPDLQVNLKKGVEYLSIKDLFFNKFSDYICSLDKNKFDQLFDNHRKERDRYCSDLDIAEYSRAGAGLFTLFALNVK